MAVRETAADGGMTATIVNPTRTEQMIDPRTVVWKTDVDGELQQTDLFHGVATLSAANAGQLELERAVGQVSVELPDRETVTIDSLALEVPEDKLSLAILRDGTLVKERRPLHGNGQSRKCSICCLWKSLRPPVPYCMSM